MRPIRFWWVMARNMFLAGAMFVYFGCLGFFPIAQVAAGLFTAPILVMVITAIWDRSPIGPIRVDFAYNPMHRFAAKRKWAIHLSFGFSF